MKSLAEWFRAFLTGLSAVAEGVRAFLTGLSVVADGARAFLGRRCPDCRVRPLKHHRDGCPIGRWDGGTWA